MSEQLLTVSNVMGAGNKEKLDDGNLISADELVGSILFSDDYISPNVNNNEVKEGINGMEKYKIEEEIVNESLQKYLNLAKNCENEEKVLNEVKEESGRNTCSKQAFSSIRLTPLEQDCVLDSLAELQNMSETDRRSIMESLKTLNEARGEDNIVIGDTTATINTSSNSAGENIIVGGNCTKGLNVNDCLVSAFSNCNTNFLPSSIDLSSTSSFSSISVTSSSSLTSSHSSYEVHLTSFSSVAPFTSEIIANACYSSNGHVTEIADSTQSSINESSYNSITDKSQQINTNNNNVNQQDITLQLAMSLDKLRIAAETATSEMNKKQILGKEEESLDSHNVVVNEKEEKLRKEIIEENLGDVAEVGKEAESGSGAHTSQHSANSVYYGDVDLLSFVKNSKAAQNATMQLQAHDNALNCQQLKSLLKSSLCAAAASLSTSSSSISSCDGRNSESIRGGNDIKSTHNGDVLTKLANASLRVKKAGANEGISNTAAVVTTGVGEAELNINNTTIPNLDTNLLSPVSASSTFPSNTYSYGTNTANTMINLPFQTISLQDRILVQQQAQMMTAMYYQQALAEGKQIDTNATLQQFQQLLLLQNLQQQALNKNNNMVGGVSESDGSYNNTNVINKNINNFMYQNNNKNNDLNASYYSSSTSSPPSVAIPTVPFLNSAFSALNHSQQQFLLQQCMNITPNLLLPSFASSALSPVSAAVSSSSSQMTISNTCASAVQVLQQLNALQKQQKQQINACSSNMSTDILNNFHTQNVSMAELQQALQNNVVSDVIQSNLLVEATEGGMEKLGAACSSPTVTSTLLRNSLNNFVMNNANPSALNHSYANLVSSQNAMFDATNDIRRTSRSGGVGINNSTTNNLSLNTGVTGLNLSGSKNLVSGNISSMGLIGGVATTEAAEKKSRRKREGKPGQIPQQPIVNDAQTAPLPENASPLLEEFRKSNRQFSLWEIQWNLLEFAKDQFGSRFIQQKLETCTEDEKQMVFMGLLPDVTRLTTDVFGNYVIQKLFQCGTAEQKRILSEQLVGDVFRLSLQMYGCRIIQKALESVPPDNQVLLVGELKNHVIKCVEDQNGNHVIQKCIERMPSDKVQFVIDAFKGQVQRMSVHCYGCRVIQRLLEHCPHSQVAALADEVMRYVMPLAQDQYGNYVVQHILEFGRDADKRTVIDMLKKNILQLATHRFASNVIERALQCSSEEAKAEIIGAALGDPAEPNPSIMTMMRDRYGNYVVQRMLEVAHEDQKDMLVYRLRDQLHVLKKFTYGKHIVSALERLQKGDTGTIIGPSTPLRSEPPMMSLNISGASSSSVYTQMQKHYHDNGGMRDRGAENQNFGHKNNRNATTDFSNIIDTQQQNASPMIPPHNFWGGGGSEGGNTTYTFSSFEQNSVHAAAAIYGGQGRNRGGGSGGRQNRRHGGGGVGGGGGRNGGGGVIYKNGGFKGGGAEGFGAGDINMNQSYNNTSSGLRGNANNMYYNANNAYNIPLDASTLANMAAQNGLSLTPRTMNAMLQQMQQQQQQQTQMSTWGGNGDFSASYGGGGIGY